MRTFSGEMSRKLIFLFKLTFITILLTSSASCEKEPDNPDTVSKEIKAINVWIKENMEALYFWNENIPTGLNPGNEPDPEALFEKMIYKPEDVWSYITSDYSSLLAELEGTPLSSGISPAFVRIANNQIVVIVEYVYPGSPAGIAGLERGDMITTIDQQTLDLDNYFDLFNKSSYQAALGMISGGAIVPTGETFLIQSAVIDADPVIHHEVMNIQGVQTGYLVYSSFRNGTNNRFRNTLDQVFQEFKTAGITNLIVDLRYNRGGEIDVAAYLAAAIAPNVVLGKDILVKYVYNKGLTQYIEQEFGKDSPNLALKFPANSFNLDLSKVYFLTGWKTASASELIITGLDPYMNVISIGDTTVGKYTGSWVIPDTNDPPKHNWAMMPIVLKYSNAQGFTDFKNGLAPDYYIDEFVLDLKPFGDPGDVVLAKARELIGGGVIAAAPKKAASSLPYSRLRDKDQVKSGILIVPTPELKGAIIRAPY